MKSLKNILYEGLLSGQDSTISYGDDIADKMCLFHWKYGKSYRYKVFKNVSGGLGGVFKKHFTKKAPVIYTSWPSDPISKNPDYPHRIKHDRYNIDYLYAIILNTKLPKAIEEYNLYNFKDVYELKNEIEFQLRSYMLDDSQKFRTAKNNFPVLTVEIRPTLKGLAMTICYHQDGMRWESLSLCHLEFISHDYKIPSCL